MKALIDTYFINLFTSVEDREWGTILDCIQPKVTDDMNASLLAPISIEEIKEVAFQLGRLKAPGPDGFQGIFYQNFWDNLMAEVSALVFDLMQGYICPNHINLHMWYSYRKSQIQSLFHGSGLLASVTILTKYYLKSWQIVSNICCWR